MKNPGSMIIEAKKRFWELQLRAGTLLLLFLLFSGTADGQSLWRVELKDKANSPWSLSKPGEFLSERAIQRRALRNIAIDESDLPVNPAYIEAIAGTGAIAVNSSRWMNSLTVFLPHDSLAGKIATFDFVTSVVCTRPDSATKRAVNKYGTPGTPLPIDTSWYGGSVYQVGQLNGQALHSRGLTGKGMMIAILDAGFYKVDELPAFDSLRREGRIAGSHDFAWPRVDIFRGHTHGMMVLSAMGGLRPGMLIGTAPHASYWLIRTEDSSTEFPVEEDNWIAGAELADSAGCDIINSSLGYSTFDLASMNHTYSDMDGKTTRSARGANMAAAKGMLVFSSAGNEGNKEWQKITTPGDADSVISVAAVDRYGVRAGFSSKGPSADGDFKPTVAAMGVNNTLEGINGAITAASGTSFASPTLAGMAACLWQARPGAPAWLVKNAIIRSAHQYHNPDTLIGYGIPDMEKALDILLASFPVTPPEGKEWSIWPLPFREFISISASGGVEGNVTIEVFSLKGERVFQSRVSGSGPHRIEQLNHLPFGVWITRITTPRGSETHKISGGRL